MKLAVLILWIALPALAGHEAGANWVVNRFKGMGYEGLSELCRKVDTPQALVHQSDIDKIEKILEEVSIETKADIVGDYVLIPSSGRCASIQLNRARWQNYFAKNFDVYGEVLQALVDCEGEAIDIEDRFDSSILTPVPRTANLLRLTDHYWLRVPGFFQREEAQSLCQGFNARKSYALLARWRLAARDEVQTAKRNLKGFFDSLPYKHPLQYEVWLEGGVTYSIDDSVPSPSVPGDSHGLICVGDPRPR